MVLGLRFVVATNETERIDEHQNDFILFTVAYLSRVLGRIKQA